jgi:hypothetical protein
MSGAVQLSSQTPHIRGIRYGAKFFSLLVAAWKMP